MIKPSEPIQIIFNRSEKPECIHYAHAALCDVQGQLLKGWGDPYYETFWRSAATPFEVLALLMNEKAQKWQFSDSEIVTMISSHNGGDKQLEAVRSILKKTDCLESSLEISIHHTCTGKYLMMLALAKALEVDLNNYQNSTHPVQVAIKNEIARSIDFPVDYISEGTDDCGTSTYWMDLTAMARAYAKLVAPEKAFLASEFEEALKKVQNAMKNKLIVTEDTNHFETDLMAGSSTLLVKSGEAGIFCVANLISGEGIALKVVNGDAQSIAPAILSILREIEWVSSELYDQLWEKYASQNIITKIK